MGLIDYLIRLHDPALGETVEIKVLNIRNGIPGNVTFKRVTRDSVIAEPCARSS
jgi:hypothetical protein